ncbi:putative membrane protein [Smittium culicis]|uniref:Putative membrane protein n=1 Tax=Smittium culicis TaxID=133412 RepID=A0A1R1YE47_9FUNG|nr:putative membrane protein [Smittium culicis]
MDPYFKDNSVYYSDFRIYLLEFLGTFILSLFGTCAQISAHPSDKTIKRTGVSELIIAFGYGIGYCLGLFLPAGIYRLHLNPVLTAAHICFKNYPLRRFPIIFLVQIIGAAAGIFLAFSIYSSQISTSELFIILNSARFFSYGSGGIGINNVVGSLMSMVSSLFIGSFLIVIGFFAIVDKRQLLFRPIVPISAGLLLVLIYLSFGPEYSSSLFNPAIDICHFFLSFFVKFTYPSAATPISAASSSPVASALARSSGTNKNPLNLANLLAEAPSSTSKTNSISSAITAISAASSKLLTSTPSAAGSLKKAAVSISSSSITAVPTSLALSQSSLSSSSAIASASAAAMRSAAQMPTSPITNYTTLVETNWLRFTLILFVPFIGGLIGGLFFKLVRAPKPTVELASDNDLPSTKIDEEMFNY